MAIPPWMIATGVLGVGAVGVAAYALSTQQQSAPYRPPAKPAGPPILFGVQRPQSLTQALTNVFNTIPVFSLPGTVTVMAAGATLPITPVLGAYNILVLPTGAAWVAVNALNSTAKTNVSGQIGTVNLAGDTTSPIAIPVVSLSGSNEIWCVWSDSSGDEQTLVTYPLKYYPAAPPV